MSLRIRFRFDGRCSLHPRYNPVQDGRPQHTNCAGCESLYVIHLYTRIAQKKGITGEGLIVRAVSGSQLENTTDVIADPDESDGSNKEIGDGE